MNDQFHRLFKRIPFSILYIQVLGLVYFFFLQCINFSFDEIQYTCPIWDCLQCFFVLLLNSPLTKMKT